MSSSQIQLYAASSLGYGAASTPLLKNAVTTDGNGQFNITKDYTCPSSSTPVYLVSRGGNPGLAGSVSNSAITLMTALGPCGDLPSVPFVNVNEVTTVGAVWALQQFMTAYDHVGTSSTNLAGLTNAFSIAADLAGFSNGLSPGNVPTGAYNVIVPSAKINAFANILSTCINTPGGTAGDTSACGQLFSAATPASGVAPIETVGAALNAALSPTTSVTTLYNLATSTGPFQPAVTTAPSSWTFSLTLMTSNIGVSIIPDGSTESLAFDADGNAWAAVQTDPTTLQMFYPNGTLGPAYINKNLGYIAIDLQGDFITEAGDFYITPANLSPAATFAPAGSGSAQFTIDGSGGIWYVSFPSGSLHRLSNTGQDSGALGNFSFPSSWLPTGLNQVWVTSNQPNVSAGLMNGSGSYVSGPSAICSACSIWSNALGRGGSLWVSASNSSTSVKSLENISSTGTVSTYTSAANPYMSLTAIDGDNQLWALGGGASASKVTSVGPLTLSGNSASMATYLADGPAGLGDPTSGVIDRSGNFWVLSKNQTGSDGYSPLGNTISIFVGVAAPTITPTALALANNAVATRP